MPDIAKRFKENPLLNPGDLSSSHPGLRIECLLNPGVFRFEEKTWLLVRVAERPEQKQGFISFPVLKPVCHFMVENAGTGRTERPGSGSDCYCSNNADYASVGERGDIGYLAGHCCYCFGNCPLPDRKVDQATTPTLDFYCRAGDFHHGISY